MFFNVLFEVRNSNIGTILLKYTHDIALELKFTWNKSALVAMKAFQRGPSATPQYIQNLVSLL